MPLSPEQEEELVEDIKRNIISAFSAIKFKDRILAEGSAIHSILTTDGLTTESLREIGKFMQASLDVLRRVHANITKSFNTNNQEIIDHISNLEAAVSYRQDKLGAFVPDREGLTTTLKVDTKRDIPDTKALVENKHSKIAALLYGAEKLQTFAPKRESMVSKAVVSDNSISSEVLISYRIQNKDGHIKELFLYADGIRDAAGVILKSSDLTSFNPKALKDNESLNHELAEATANELLKSLLSSGQQGYFKAGLPEAVNSLKKKLITSLLLAQDPKSHAAAVKSFSDYLTTSWDPDKLPEGISVKGFNEMVANINKHFEQTKAPSAPLSSSPE